jgi:hypothetical protein
MRYFDYKILYKRLNCLDDIPYLANEFKICESALFSILSQKIVRSATSRYYKIKNYSDKLLQDWLSGKSFCILAKELKFPEVLTASLVLQAYGLSKRRFWKYLTHLELVKEARVKNELYEVAETDWVYSPKALESQRKRGKEVENFVKEWLEKRLVKFRTQAELEKKYKKTPDFLLDTPLKISNLKINWIECKAGFGDYFELKRNAKKQLLPYRKLFGSGMVVYWEGYLEDLRFFRNILVTDKAFFTA